MKNMIVLILSMLLMVPSSVVAAEGDVMKIGTETWPGYMPIYVARDMGFFEDEGLNVEIKRYIALGELSKDYVVGELHGRANLTLDAASEAFQGLDHRIILAIDYSSGSDAIAAQTNIRSIKALKGRSVGLEMGTLEEFFVAYALKKHGMSLADVVVVNADPEKTGQMLEAGEIDAAATHEPFLSKVIQTGKVNAIFSSADAPGLITDVFTFRTDFIEAHPEKVQAFVRAYFKAIAYWKAQPWESNTIMAKEFGDTPASIELQMQGVTMLDEKDNMKAFQDGPQLRSLYGNMQQISKFVSEHQNNDKTIDVKKIIDPRFLQSYIESKRSQ